jgi:HAD superfamily hydrolase (TIGR01484 family)
MELPIKLISTDFDGTLFAESDTPPIPAQLIELISRLQSHGAKWVINTGRDMSSLLESLGQSHIHAQPDYLVLVEREIHKRCGSRYVSVAGWNDRCSREQAELFRRVRVDIPELVEWVHRRFEVNLYEDAFSPLCVIAANNGDMDEIHGRLEEYCLAVPELMVVRNDVYARFSHRAYNKGTALAEITRILKLSREQVFAVGDHLNDLPMLSKAHAEFIAAPANAVREVRDSVRQQGGFVCRLSGGKGVCEALEFFLGDHLMALNTKRQSNQSI